MVPCDRILWILSILRDLIVSLLPYFIDHLWVLFPDVCMVVTSEIAVDIVKHAFITKFNDITADVCILISSSVFGVEFWLIL